MKIFLLLALSTLVFLSCSTNMVTGRKQLKLVSETELQSMASQEYNTFLSSNKVVQASPKGGDAAMVQRVGNRIATAIKAFYNAQGKGAILDGYKWEFNLVENKEVNAWCMPGGKVVVYSGILPITTNENGLAVVMGHEIAHAIAQHGSERMSQGMLQQLGGVALQVALSSKPAETQNLFNTAYGIGSNVGLMLPFSRQAENEADKFGLYFSSMAGYDPQEAIPFWQRMAKVGGNKPPEFLSSHPSDETRINKLQQIMPEALKYFNLAKNGSQ